MYEERKKMVTQTRTKMNHLISCLRLTTKPGVDPANCEINSYDGFRRQGCGL